MDYRKIMGVEKLAEDSDHGSGVKIAVLDSGTPRPTLHGWPFIGSHAAPDEFGHATAVASILFGGWGITGLCSKASPGYYQVLDSSGTGSASSVAKGIYMAIDDDVDLINLSLGFMRTEECPKTLEKACEAAFEAGKPVICAAGNDGGPVNWPAALKTTISVGSSGENGLKTPFSSVGEVDFVAPGANLGVICPDGRIKTVSGTSFSAAMVTGVSALLCSITKSHELKSPDTERLMRLLREMASDVDAPGWDADTGYGLIDGKNVKNIDPAVCMKIPPAFFDRIFNKIKKTFKTIKAIIGQNNKEKKNGGV